MKKQDLCLLRGGWFRGHRALPDTTRGRRPARLSGAAAAWEGAPGTARESRSPRFRWACLRGRICPELTVIIWNSDSNDEACEVVLAVWLFSSARSLGVQLLLIKRVDFLWWQPQSYQWKCCQFIILFPNNRFVVLRNFCHLSCKKKSYVSQSDFPKVLHFFDSFFFFWSILTTSSLGVNFSEYNGVFKHLYCK